MTTPQIIMGSAIPAPETPDPGYITIWTDGTAGYYKASGGTVVPLGLDSARIVISGGTVTIGDVIGGNTFSISPAGNITLAGSATAWDDLQFQLIGQRLESPSSDVVQNTAQLTVTYQADAGTADYTAMNIQLSHRWKPGSIVSPHLHWWQVGTAVVNWALQYRWQRQGTAITSAWTTSAMTANAFSYTSGTINQISDSNNITPPAGYYPVSDILQCRIVRDVSNAFGLFGKAEAAPVNIEAVTFDVHFEIDGFGSNQEYTK